MSDEQTRLEAINAKRIMAHPVYPWLRVDMRTQREVEESRNLKHKHPILRLAKKAKKMGRSFKVARDLDGAYRIANRLDEGKGLEGIS